MSDKWKVPAQVRLSLWLGLEKEQYDWIAREDDGLPTVVAEAVSLNSLSSFCEKHKSLENL